MGAVRSEPGNGDSDTVETPMSPLAYAKEQIERQQRIAAARVAHLRQTAYRGVDTSAHLPPTMTRREVKHCVYRGQSYEC